MWPYDEYVGGASRHEIPMLALSIIALVRKDEENREGMIKIDTSELWRSNDEIDTALIVLQW